MSDTHDWMDDPRLVAYALGEWSELSSADVAEIDGALGRGDGTEDPRCREALEGIQALIPGIERALRSGDSIVARDATTGGGSGPGEGPVSDGPRLAGEARAQIALAARRGTPSSSWGVPAMAAAALALVAGGLAWKLGNPPVTGPQDEVAMSDDAPADSGAAPKAGFQAGATVGSDGETGRAVFDWEKDKQGQADVHYLRVEGGRPAESPDRPSGGRALNQARQADGAVAPMPKRGMEAADSAEAPAPEGAGKVAGKSSLPMTDSAGAPVESVQLGDAGPVEKGKSIGAAGYEDTRRVKSKKVQSPGTLAGRKRKVAGSGERTRGRSPVAASKGAAPSQEPAQVEAEEKRMMRLQQKPEGASRSQEGKAAAAVPKPERIDRTRGAMDLDERIAGLDEDLADALPLPENPFVDTAQDAFSTFSIDVDTASYAAARSAILSGRKPRRESIRPEEFINYFSYVDGAPKPGDARPFAVHVDTGAAPWAPEHRLVRIGLKARPMDFAERRRSSLVFLVDVSGSMRKPNKLPLVKKALAILTESLHPDDRVAIAVYASKDGLALDSTPVAAREAILQSLERLNEGGSTDGGSGIRLAYSVARKHFIEGGVNRVVLCTDGDFNVGITDKAELEELIAGEAKSGVELTVLGFGGGSVAGDERMEALSGRGNGNYAMIDSELEARKVLASEVGGTLLTVAKDVKIQVAWNPAEVGAFRLIGYENRMLTHAEFLDDRKDAGEIGAGHGVTALYEVVPATRPDLLVLAGLEDQATTQGFGLGGGAGGARVVGEGENEDKDAEADAVPKVGGDPPAAFGGEGMLEVRLRYKEPGGETSVGFAVAAADGGAGFNGAPADLRFSASVAAFAMMLRGSESVHGVTFKDVRSWALESKGADPGGLREGFIRLVEQMMEREREEARPKVR